MACCDYDMVGRALAVNAKPYRLLKEFRGARGQVRERHACPRVSSCRKSLLLKWTEPGSNRRPKDFQLQEAKNRKQQKTL